MLPHLELDILLSFGQTLIPGEPTVRNNEASRSRPIRHMMKSVKVAETLVSAQRVDRNDHMTIPILNEGSIEPYHGCASNRYRYVDLGCKIQKPLTRPTPAP